MTVESTRRVGLTWPATGSAKAGGMNAPTLAEIEQAFQEWISEARARGCPDDTGVAVYGPDPNDYPFGRRPGHMSVQWKAADDVVGPAKSAAPRGDVHFCDTCGDTSLVATAAGASSWRMSCINGHQWLPMPGSQITVIKSRSA
jgi:hypothetical protein